MLSIRCGHCEGIHDSVTAVKQCYENTSRWLATPAINPDVATERQLKYIADLGGDSVHAAKLNKREASAYIYQLKKQGRKVKMTTPNHEPPQSQSQPTHLLASGMHTTAPVKTDPRRETKIPLMLLDTVPAGRYAVRPDDTTPHTFIRVSRPTKGQYRGTFKVQTQHSDAYKMALTVWPSGSLWWENKSVEDALLQVIVDPARAAMEYGSEIGRCCNCGKRLTDQRSRYYGIGPECEKHRQDIIDYVDEQKGVYVG